VEVDFPHEWSATGLVRGAPAVLAGVEPQFLSLYE